MAIRKTIDIDINTNADEAAKEFDNLSKSTKVANDSLEGLNKTFEEANGDIQPLTARMGEAEDRLYELAAAGDTASREYQGLLQKVGDYRKVQIQTDLAVDAAATTLGQKLGGALTGATGGFSAVQGVMGLVGGESEELEKALLKVQSALAIQQGVQGIRAAIPAFKQLGTSALKALKGIKTGIAATGIGVLLIAVGAIVAYWDEITELLGVNNESLEEQLEIEKQIADEKEKQLSQIKKIVSNNDNFIKRKYEILKLEEDIKDLSIDQAANQDEIFKKQLQIVNLKQTQNRVQAEGYKELLSKQEQANLIIERETLKREEQRLIAQKTFDDAKTADEAAAERRKKRIDDAKELSRIQKEAIDTEIAEEIALQQKLDEIQRENEDRFRTEQENELLFVEEKYDTLQAMAQGNAEALEEIELARLNEQNDVKLKFAEKEIAIDDDKSKKQIAALEAVATTEKAIQDAKFSNASAGIALVKSLAGENKKLQAAAIVAESAVGIAQIIIATQTANAATVAQGAALAIPSAGASVAAATALVLQTNIAAGISIGATVAAAGKGLAALGEGGSVQGGDVTGGGGGGGSVPNFNVVGDSGVNQLASLQQQPTQAFVVSGDVTTAQALDRNRVQNATL